MIDKRFWSGAIVVVTLIVAGAGALPELLLRPASTGPTVVLPLSAPKAEPIAQFEQTAAIARRAPMPIVNRADSIALPEESIAAAPLPVAAALETPKSEPGILATAAPAPLVALPPVQPVGIAAADAPDAVLPANPQAMPASPARPNTDKPARLERTAQRPVKPRQNARPAVYPIGEFLAWRR